VLEAPDDFFRDTAQHFKNSRTVTVTRIPGEPPSAPGWVLRRLNYGRLIHRLRDWARPSRACRAFFHGLFLEQAGVATPRVLAAGEVRCCRWPLRAYLLTEEVVGARTLWHVLRQDTPVPELLVDRLAELLARLHVQGFSHRDLKAANVLIASNGQPMLIDLDALRAPRHLADRRAVADLARLARDLIQRRAEVHTGQLRRFVKGYARGRQRQPWRWWWRQIERQLNLRGPATT
jgi:tRNA A-37 threonylcarbamoyl transferase component Bud32